MSPYEPTHTESHLILVPSTTPIDYNYDGGQTLCGTWGEHVVNTEVYFQEFRSVMLTLVLGSEGGGSLLERGIGLKYVK